MKKESFARTIKATFNPEKTEKVSRLPGYKSLAHKF